MTEQKRLTDYSHWCAYRPVRRPNGKVGKPPVDPQTGRYADVRNPATWGSYSDARRYADRLGLPGVGFVLTEQDPFTCIDLDGCISGPELSPLASEIIGRLDTYAELSPSGKGLHVWVKGRSCANLTRNQTGLEIYSHDRFVTWTGRRWPGTPNRITEVDLGWLFARFPATQERKTAAPPCGYSTCQDDDSQLWALIFKTDRTGRAERLYRGDMAVVGNDHSLAVIVLLNSLARFTRGDRQRMKRMIGQTAMPQEKWGRGMGNSTWLDHQIENSCSYIASGLVQKSIFFEAAM